MDREEEAAYRTPHSMQTPRLPEAFDAAIHKPAMDLDGFLSQEERPATAFDAKVAAYREVALSHILSFRGQQTVDIPETPGISLGDPLRWPPWLYVPTNTIKIIGNVVPASNHYGHDWTVGVPENTASVATGILYDIAQLNPTTNAGESAESGVGVFYTPSMTLGAIDLQASVNCSGTLRWFLEIFPRLAAGHVDVKAELILAAWQVIPGGFDLLGWTPFYVANIRGDQSVGPEEYNFTNNFSSEKLSAPFVVQGGRNYMLGVVARIGVTSGLTAAAAGGSLFPLSNSQLRAWGSMTCVVMNIHVKTKRVDIP